MFTSLPTFQSTISTTAHAGAAIAESAIGSSNATTKRSTGCAAAVAAGIVLFGLLSPAKASVQQESVSVFPDLPVIATTGNDNSHAAIAVPARNRAMALTSHSPWLAPVGHRQPRKIDAPKNEVLSAWERQQRRQAEELDRRLIICRGC